MSIQSHCRSIKRLSHRLMLVEKSNPLHRRAIRKSKPCLLYTYTGLLTRGRMKQYAMLVLTYNILLFQKLIFWTSLVQHRVRLVPYVNNINYCLLITNTETVCFVWPTPSLLKTFYDSHALTCWAGKNSR